MSLSSLRKVLILERPRTDILWRVWDVTFMSHHSERDDIRR